MRIFGIDPGLSGAIAVLENEKKQLLETSTQEIIEAQKRAIKTVGDLEIAVSAAMKSSDKTLLIVIYNNQNQRRYIGVNLN